MDDARANPPTLVDLFCGAGGISHGFQQAGFRVVAGVDSDGDSLQTFAENHAGARVVQADLATLPPKDLALAIGVRPGAVDCLAGGPPCQGFSRNRAFRHVNGQFVDDPRNHLYWNFFEYVGYVRPRIVLLENVPEILIKADGHFREAVFERFRRLGYDADARVLNAADFGVPQRRRRAFFLARSDGHAVRFPDAVTLPAAGPGRRTPSSREFLGTRADAGQPTLIERPIGPTVWDAIGDLHGRYAESIDDEIEYSSAALTRFQIERRNSSHDVRNHFPWPLSERQLRRIRLLGQGEGQLHLPKELQTADGYGSAYRRLQADAQALTITTWMFHPGSGMFTHPIDDRVITIREAARLQSFQDDFVFFGRYHSKCRQVGNAVAPLVARSLALSILESFRAPSSQSPTLAATP